MVGAGVGVAAAPAIAQGVLGLIGFGSQGVVAGKSIISYVLYVLLLRCISFMRFIGCLDASQHW